MVLLRQPRGFQSMAWGCITPSLSVVEEVGRGLRVDWPLIQQGEAVLPDRHVLVREHGRNEARRHVAVKRNRRAHHRGHHGQAGSPEEAAPVGARLAAEEGAVRRNRIPRKELVQVAGVAVRGILGRHVQPCSSRLFSCLLKHATHLANVPRRAQVGAPLVRRAILEPEPGPARSPVLIACPGRRSAIENPTRSGKGKLNRHEGKAEHRVWRSKPATGHSERTATREARRCHPD